MGPVALRALFHELKIIHLGIFQVFIFMTPKLKMSLVRIEFLSADNEPYFTCTDIVHCGVEPLI